MDWSYSTSQMLSYYPKYEYLDNVVTLSGKKKLKLYVDLKGCAQSLFQEWAVRRIIDHSTGTRLIDTSLFFAVLEFIAFHKSYAKKRELDLDMYFFMETGESIYHTEIFSGYKAGRKSTDFFGLTDDKREFFFSILKKNYDVMEKVVNKIPNMVFIRLVHLEADFMPFYLMKYILDKEDVSDSCNIVYSPDKDLCQCMDQPNIFQFFRHYKKVQMLSEKDIFSHWLKEDLNIEHQAQWFPLALSLLGDSSDGFNGIKSIGSKSIAKVFPTVMSMCGNDMKNVYQNILEKKSIFNKSYIPENKIILKIIENEEIIIRNLKLCSFQLLSDYVNGGFPTYVIERKNQIQENISNTYKASGPKVMFDALVKTGLFDNVNESTIVNLF